MEGAGKKKKKISSFLHQNNSQNNVQLTPESCWRPFHLAVYKKGRLAAVPCAVPSGGKRLKAEQGKSGCLRREGVRGITSLIAECNKLMSSFLLLLCRTAFGEIKT